MNRKETLIKYSSVEISRRKFLQQTALVAGSAVATNALCDLLGSAPANAAQVDPSDPALTSQEIKFNAADGTGIGGYLTRPNGDSVHPAIMVISAWDGLRDHIRDVARRFAKAGYVALAPDLLSRAGGTNSFADQAAAIAAGRKLSDDTIMSDLNGAVNYLKRQNFVRPNRIGVIGFCWGGGKALLFTTRSKDLAAAVIYYGDNPANLDDVKNIAVPVLGQYGGADDRITSGVPKLEEAMKKYGKSFEYKIYPGAPHAFNTDDSPRSYREEAAKEAWAKTLEFFKNNLQS